MKLKTAHIILAAASLATFTMLAGCGTNNANELTSPGYTVDQINPTVSVLSLAITPQSASGHVGQNVQLQVTGNLSDGTQADITQFVLWDTSNPTIATVSATGLVSAKLPGTVTITASRGSATSSIQFTVNPFINRAFVSNKGNNSIAAFDVSATGAVTAAHVISGTATGLSAPGQILVDNARQELYVANTGAAEIDVFYLQAEGNVAPLRKIKSSAFTVPTGIALNTANSELFVLSTASVSVFNQVDSGDAVTPKRVPIAGALTTMAATGNSLALNANQVFVPNAVNVLAFPQSAVGNVAPSRTITGPVAAFLKAAKDVSVDGTDLFVSDPGALIPSIYRFDLNLADNAAPAQTFTEPGAMIAPGGTLPVGTLWETDQSSVRLYNRATGALVRSFTSASLSTPASVVIAPSW